MGREKRGSRGREKNKERRSPQEQRGGWDSEPVGEGACSAVGASTVLEWKVPVECDTSPTLVLGTSCQRTSQQLGCLETDLGKEGEVHVERGAPCSGSAHLGSTRVTHGTGKVTWRFPFPRQAEMFMSSVNQIPGSF